MILFRRFAAKLADGTISLYRAVISPRWQLKELFKVGVIVPGHVSGHALLATTEAFTMPLPYGYTSASYAQLLIRAEGVLKVAVASPAHTTSTLLIYGSSTEKGQFVITDKITSITVTNPTAGNVQFDYCVVQLPDLTLDASYYGLMPHAG